ncbi:hypothetical protein G6F65_010662 [Rhizopus arrhizus]|nr:hypothetical protein G6F65_010662 [Rhizopus arrhizus]
MDPPALRQEAEHKHHSTTEQRLHDPRRQRCGGNRVRQRYPRQRFIHARHQRQQEAERQPEGRQVRPRAAKELQSPGQHTAERGQQHDHTEGVARIQPAGAGHGERGRHRQHQADQIGLARMRGRVDGAVTDEAIQTGKYRNQAHGGVDHPEGGKCV